jgi:hypothetical protein
MIQFGLLGLSMLYKGIFCVYHFGSTKDEENCPGLIVMSIACGDQGQGLPWSRGQASLPLLKR